MKRVKIVLPPPSPIEDPHPLLTDPPLGRSGMLHLHQVNGPEVTPVENTNAAEAPPRPNGAPVEALPSINPANDPRLGVAVGPRPEPALEPKTYEDYVATAKRVLGRQGKIDMVHLWVALAQAEATNRVAVELQRLNTFLGADGWDAPEEGEEVEPRLIDVFAEAVETAQEIKKGGKKKS